ncbi:MAG: molybdopterin-dependent oxidoreductase [bacterium]|nr:molybdopterin-dependent oxidoreductase [bacterium]
MSDQEIKQEKKKFRFTRRKFLKATAAISAITTANTVGCSGRKKEEIREVKEETADNITKSFPSACPYCGVGCGTLIQVENGKIVGMVPDKSHPTNKGMQCIKGLTANEPIYVDRLTKVMVRKDVWEEWKKPGHGDLEFTSKTKGKFDDEYWVEVSYEESGEMTAHKLAHQIKKYGGNCVGLYGSGQLTVEGQYLENKFMKGVIGSNTMEANARMCMTSAVTAYFKTLGSDAPPTCYEDLEMCDFISFWGHNPREAHPIVFWRVADYKEKSGISTMVVDPRRTGTVKGFEDINPRNSYHAQIKPNSDITFLNNIAYVLLTKHPDVIDHAFMKANTTGHEEYIKGIKEKYDPAKTKAVSGLEVSFVEEVAGKWAEATRKGKKRGTGGVLTYWGIGYNQSIHGQHNVISIINLHLLTGNIGRAGCGPHSQTGQPNAMGERLTGGLTGRLPFNQGLKAKGKYNEKGIKLFSDIWCVPQEKLKQAADSSNSGYAVGMMERGLLPDNDPRKVRSMFLIYATHIDLPETKTLVRPALDNMFVVAQDIYRHAPNNLYADVVYPAATWGECGGVYIQSERRIFVTDKAAEPPENCKPDLDIVVDKGKHIADLLGMDSKKIFPYGKNEQGFYNVEEVFEEMAIASEGSDSDISGILKEAKKRGVSPYQVIRECKGVQWPAPTAEIAAAGGTKRRYMNQEKGWKDKPYGMFRTGNGKGSMKLCHQDYSKYGEVIDDLRRVGVDKDFLLIDNMDLLKKVRDYGLTPEMPDFDYAKKPASEIPKDKYPFWLNLGVVYEHFHTAKTIRAATTKKLVMEQYVEMHENDAKRLGLKDGDWVKVSTLRGSYEGRISLGPGSKVRPARNLVAEGQLFSPWNLSVADSADPDENRWLVNAVTHRAFDPVSGQADFKKCAARIDKITKVV